MKSGKATILIIEDHDATRTLLGASFRKNYRVVTQKDGLDGMAWLALGELPDLIILDMQMPRVDGAAFLRQIHTSGVFKDIPVLILSANETEADVLKCFELGAWGFIQKPFNPVLLQEKALAILQKTKSALPTYNLLSNL